MRILRLLAFFLASLYAPQIGATDYSEKYPSLMQIENQRVNLPDEDSNLFGITMENVDEEFCVSSCQDTSCSLLTYQASKKRCYLSNRDPDVINRGLYDSDGSLSFINTNHYPSLNNYIFMPYTPPWTDSSNPPEFVTMDECAQMCNAQEDACYSFSYTPINQTCYMYNMSLLLNKAHNVQPKVSSPSRVYFEKQAASLTDFYHLYGYRIEGDSTPVQTHSECVQRCLNSPTCKSLSMKVNLDDTDNLNCRLSDYMYNDDSTNKLIKDSSSMYFYMKIVSLPGGTNVYPYRSQGAVTSNNFPNSYPLDNATGIIVSPQGTSLSANLTRLNLRMIDPSQPESIDTLTINDVKQGKSDIGKVVQVDENNEITANFVVGEGNAHPSSQDFSYRLSYKWDWVCNKDSLELEGSKNPQILANPGFPDSAVPNTCQWVIKSSNDSSSIYLSFTKFPAGSKTLTIKGNNEKSITDGNFRSDYFGSEVSISYNSSANSDNSFQLYYLETAAPESPAAYVVSKEETIKMGNNDTKIISFNRTLDLTEAEASDSIIELRYKVEIQDLTALDTYSNIIFESLNFGRKWYSECYDGFIWVGIVGPSTSSSATFLSCGVSQASQITRYPAVYNFIDIRATLFQRKDDNNNYLLKNNEREGFRIKIQTGIPAVIKEREVAVVSAQALQPDRDDEQIYYKPNQLKLWAIASQTAKVPRVEVKAIDLATMPHSNICDNDRLYITQEMPNNALVTEELCGDNSLITKPTLYFPHKNLNIHVKFLSDDRHTSTGFTVNVDYVNVYNGSIGNKAQVVSEPGYLVSSNYPRLITGATISWNLTSKTYSRCRVSFDFATYDENCKLIRLYLPGGGLISECVEAYSDPLEFQTGTVLTWIASDNMPNRLAANVTFYQKISEQKPVNPNIGGNGYMLIENAMLNIPSPESGGQGISITNVEQTMCLKWCSSLTYCMAVMYKDNKQTCYLSTDSDLNVMSRGLISDTDSSTFLATQNYPNIKFFIFMAVIPPFPVETSQTNIQIEECAYYCNWIHDNCQSFSFESLTATCYIYGKSFIGSNGGFDSSEIKPKQSNPSTVYFEKQSGSLYFFNHLSGYYISNTDTTQNYIGTSEECAQRCLRSTNCKSFSFSYGQKSNCNMSSQSYRSSNSDGLIENSNSVYFYMKIIKSQDVLRSSGQITGPLFPNSYPLGSLNITTVTAPQGTRFSANITRLNLPPRSDDRRKCLDTLLINGQSYCDEQMPFPLQSFATTGSSLEPQLVVELISNQDTGIVPPPDSVSYNYRIEYMWDWTCEINPGVNLQASFTPQRLASPGFPNKMTKDGPCQWTIYAPTDSHVFLSFVKLPSVGSLNVVGENNNTEVKSGDFGKNVTITYPKAQMYDAFELYYLITEGSATNYSVSQYTKNVSFDIGGFDVVSIPIVTSNISASIIDIWYVVNILSVIPNTYTSISFNKLGFGKAEWFDECYDGFVSIGDSLSLKSELITLKRFCGTNAQGTSMRLDSVVDRIVIWGRLYQRHMQQSSVLTLSPEERSGFEVFIETGVSSLTDDETRTIQNTTTFSPYIGDNDKYMNNQNDVWVVRTGELGAKLTIQSIDLATIPDHPEICDNDRLTVTYQSQTYSICGKNTNSQPILYFAIPGPIIRVQFQSDDRHVARGFNASVVYVRIYNTIDFETQIVEEPGFLISPNYPQLVANVEGSWLIKSDSFTHFQLKLHFASANEFCKELTLSDADESHSICYSGNNGTLEFKVGTTVTWTPGNHLNRFAAEVIYVNKKEETEPSSGLSAGAVAGIVIGVLLFLAIVAALVYLFMQNRNQPQGTGIASVFFNRNNNESNIVRREVDESRGIDSA